MKNILTGRILSWAVLSVFLLSANAVAQTEEFKVGQKVLFNCPSGCVGTSGGWVPATIEVIIGPDDYQVRWGTGRYHYNRAGKDRIRTPEQLEKEKKQGEMQAAFARHADKYRDSIQSMMMIHDPKLRSGSNVIYGPPNNPEGWAKIMADLGELDSVCKTQFPGIQNPPSAFVIEQMWGTWCEIAARRVEYEKRGRSLGASHSVGPLLNSMKIKLREVLEDPELRVPDLYQMLAFEREKWRAAGRAEIASNFSKIGAEIPPDVFKELEDLGDQLKTKIEQTAPTRSWKQPPYADAAVEGLIRREFAAKSKGAQILKIGTSYADWKPYDAKTMVGRDSNYEYYKIEKGKTRYKRGLMLVKVPGRPFCQSQEWIVKQVRAGAGYSPMKIDLLGSSGVFMPCQ